MSKVNLGKESKITPAQIAAWKAKYGQVFEISTPLTDDGKEVAVGIFRKPDLKVISAAGTYMESDPVRAGQIMFNACWLGGDKDVYDSNDEAKVSAIKRLGSLFKVRASEIKKL